MQLITENETNPQILTREDLTDIRSRLDRVDEHILNLNCEIGTFLNQRPDESLSDDKQTAAHELWGFYVKRGIPPRFSVIAGEIVHHLRSCLDNIVWLLSSERYRQSNERDIGFPICRHKALTEGKLAGYKSKVAGIESPAALALIERIQPYNAADAFDDPLEIVNELNRIDKHHNLVFVVNTVHLKISVPVIQSVVIRPFEREPKVLMAAPLTDKMELKFTFQVAFRQFGRKENEPVIAALTHLYSAVSDVVKMFAGEI